MQVNPYLNFDGNARQAFEFYQSIFGGELAMMKMTDAPESEKLPANEQEMLLHVSLPLSNGQTLMASDCLSSRGDILTKGNNNDISIAPDSREEATRLFNGLSEGGNIQMPMEDMFWGDYFGSFIDKFGDDQL
jgi:PhnB protein